METPIKVYTYDQYMLNFAERIVEAIKQGNSESLVIALKLCRKLEEALVALD